MKKFYDEDFKEFPTRYIRLQCPPGDYSEVRVVPSYCEFLGDVVFGSSVVIGTQCMFKKRVTLGPFCEVDGFCTFEGPTEVGRFSKVRTGCHFCDRTNIEKGCTLENVRFYSKRICLDEDIHFVGPCNMITMYNHNRYYVNGGFWKFCTGTELAVTHTGRVIYIGYRRLKYCGKRLLHTHRHGPVPGWVDHTRISRLPYGSQNERVQ